MPKIFVFDLETSSLDANRGNILCAAGKWLGEKKVFKWRIDDEPNYGTTPRSWRNDKRIVRDLVRMCTEADAVVAYYGGYGKFDVPFLNTRAVSHGLNPCPQLSIIDPYIVARGKLKLSNNSMKTVGTLLKCKNNKYNLPWEAWGEARYGDKKAMSTLIKYCVNDVLCLEEIYQKLLPLISTHPYVVGDTPVNPEHIDRQCPACGSTKTMSRGNRYTKKFKILRRQCRECKHYFESGRTTRL